MELKMIIGNNLKRIRLSRSITRSELAKGLGTTSSCISNIETALRYPSLKLLCELSMFFRQDIRSFLTTRQEYHLPADRDWTKEWLLVGRNIKKLRQKLNLSQYDLARRAGFTTTFVCNLENGKYRFSLSSLCRLAESLNVEVWELFTGPILSRSSALSYPIDMSQ